MNFITIAAPYLSGNERYRSSYLPHAKRALYHLSYDPKGTSSVRTCTPCTESNLAPAGGACCEEADSCGTAPQVINIGRGLCYHCTTTAVHGR